MTQKERDNLMRENAALREALKENTAALAFMQGSFRYCLQADHKARNTAAFKQARAALSLAKDHP